MSFPMALTLSLHALEVMFMQTKGKRGRGKRHAHIPVELSGIRPSAMSFQYLGSFAQALCVFVPYLAP